MTVNTTTSRVSYAGNGSTTTFSVPFYFLAAADLVVIRTTSAGVQTTLVLNTDYTVTGAGNPAGGSVVCTTPPASATSLVIFRDPAATQLTDYQANDPFPAETHERALDKLTMLAQRLKDLASRSLTLSDGDTTTASAILPSPAANNVIGWNATASGLQNVTPQNLATIVSTGTTYADVFTGNGSQTDFTLTANPANQANLDVSVGGVTQLPGTDYLWTSGTTLTLTTAPANGVKILARYAQALAQQTGDAAAITFQQAGTTQTRTVQSKLRDTVSVKDFGAVGDGVTDDTAAIQAAINASKSVLIPPTSNFYKITAPLNLPNKCVLYMDGVNLTNTAGAGLFRFPSGGGAVIHAAKATLQTNTTTAGAAISIAPGATAVTQAYIYGFPLIIAANTIVNAAFRGVDMSGFYRSYLEVQSYGFYYGIYADGNNGATLATYYNVLMKPDIRCGDQGYAILFTNLVNATSIVSPFISGGDTGYGGIFFDNNSGSNNVIGGYIEAFAKNASSAGIIVNDSPSNTFSGIALDQSIGDTTSNYALKVLGGSSGNSFINMSFAGSWNDTSKMLLNTATGKNSFIGNGYTNAYVFGLSGVGLVNEGTFVNKLTAYDNVVIGTAGKGVDFTADGHAAGMTSEVLDDYEEGTWTPNQGAGLTVSGAFSSSGTYTKVGRQVTVTGQLNGATSIAASAAGVLCSNLPFSASIESSGTRHNVSLADGGVVYVSATSVYSIGAAASTTRIYFAVTYFVS